MPKLYSTNREWVVVSSVDGGDVFPAESVRRWASAWGVTPRVAAFRLAKENEDPLTSKRLSAVARADELV